jgi:hypothetical protein
MLALISRLSSTLTPLSLPFHYSHAFCTLLVQEQKGEEGDEEHTHTHTHATLVGAGGRGRARRARAALCRGACARRSAHDPAEDSTAVAIQHILTTHGPTRGIPPPAVVHTSAANLREEPAACIGMLSLFFYFIFFSYCFCSGNDNLEFLPLIFYFSQFVFITSSVS